jgi:ribonuclease HI
MSQGKHVTVFQAEIYVILACVHEIETQDRPEKYVSISSDSQAALKALQAYKKSPHLCDSARKYAVGLYWVPGLAGIRGNEVADSLQKTVQFKVF